MEDIITLKNLTSLTSTLTWSATMINLFTTIFHYWTSQIGSLTIYLAMLILKKINKWYLFQKIISNSLRNTSWLGLPRERWSQLTSSSTLLRICSSMRSSLSQSHLISSFRTSNKLILPSTDSSWKSRGKIS